MGLAGNGTIDIDNLDLQKAVRGGLKKLVDEASIKLKVIQVKDVAYRNAQQHRTPQKELVARANNRETHQKEVDRNNEENIRNHNKNQKEKEAAAAAAATRAAATIFGDIVGNFETVLTASSNAITAILTAISNTAAAIALSNAVATVAVTGLTAPLNTVTTLAVAGPIVPTNTIAIAITPVDAVDVTVDPSNAVADALSNTVAVTAAPLIAVEVTG